MSLKLFSLIFLLKSIDAIFLTTLPSAEVDKFHQKLFIEKPHARLPPSELKLKIVNLEQGHHGRKASDAKNLVDLAESLNLTILVKALEETGLDSVIDHEGKYTLLAPTNEAFRSIPDWANKLPLKELLKFHVARGLIESADLSNDFLARSILAKRDIRFNIYKNGSVVTANGSPVTATDFRAHNGILHIIDRVMVGIYERGGTIVKELHRCPVFKTLGKLVGLAGLCETLNEKGPFTLMAPSDTAFAKLPADVVQHLEENPELLRQVLKYHVITGTWYSAGLEDSATLLTANGAAINVSLRDGAVLLNGDVKVTSADGTASNGVIHGVDSVLIPPSMMRKIEKSMTSTKPHLKGRNGD